MIRPLLAASALLTTVACTQATDQAPAEPAAPVETAAPAADVVLPPDATGFITANPLPLDPEGTEVRRDDYGRPYEYALLGEKLPHFAGTLIDGTPFDSDKLAHWTVIDVWGLWCSDCMADAPYSAALASAAGQDPDLDFLSIHVPASPARTTPEEMFKRYGSVQGFFDEKGYSYPVLVDTDASLRAALKVAWTPSYILVSPDGVVKGYRSEFSAAHGEPIKDFMKDIARVKGESKKTDISPLRLGPGGVAGLTAGTPFAIEAIEAAFPGRKVVSTRIGTAEDTYPAFEVQDGPDVLLTLTPDWSLGKVAQIRTTSPLVAGPRGEQVGTFRLSGLTEAEQALCTAGEGGAAATRICPDANDTGVERVFRLDDPAGTDGVLVEFTCTFPSQAAGN